MLETLNATSWGPMLRMLEQTGADILMVQEHHMLDDKITAVHGRLKREGWSSWFAWFVTLRDVP